MLVAGFFVVLKDIDYLFIYLLIIEIDYSISVDESMESAIVN